MLSGEGLGGRVARAELQPISLPLRGSVAGGFAMTGRYVEPEPLEGYPEAQLDAVDASVFSGDCYASPEGKARMTWYVRRWIKELELHP